MGNRWNRIYVEKTRQHRELTQQAKEVYAYLHGEQTDPAGVVVERREGESVNEAITHALGVPPRSRRRWRGAINDLVREGFLFVDGDQVILPNWRDRQEWGNRNGPKGPVPSPIRKPEKRRAGYRLQDPREDRPVRGEGRGDPVLTHTPRAEPRHNRDSDCAEPEHDRDSDCAEPRQRSEGNHLESFSAGSRNAAEFLGQARPGQAKKGVRVNMHARGTPSGSAPSGGAPGLQGSGSNGAAVHDIETGEILDPAGFKASYDSQLAAREAEYEELPPDEVTPDVAVEAASLFDEVAP